MPNFMDIAVKEAFSAVRSGDGGPFGAVVVRKGVVIARAHNMVLKTNDPTMHAEVTAIKKACAKLKRFDLSDCEIYSSCEPCPMCYAAIHWAKMKKLYFGCTRSDAAKIGFDDKFIYDVLNGKVHGKKRQVKVFKTGRESCLKPFMEFEKLDGKIMY